MSTNNQKSTRNYEAAVSAIQTLQMSDSEATTLPSNQYAHSAEVSVQSIKRSKYMCPHQDKRPNGKVPDVLVGDAHLVNCNICGAYFPTSGSMTMRAVKRHSNMNKLYTSDILRSLYSQCQSKGGNPVTALKISTHY